MNDRSDVLVVGGGLGGLAAATLLARDGRRVKLLERASRPGGRALSLPVGGTSGAAMNLGPRALYRGGPAERLLAELGVSWTGFSPTTSKVWLADGADVFAAPASVVALLVSRRFSWSERRGLLVFFARLDATRRATLAERTTQEWLDDLAISGRARRFLESMIRLGTYANAPDQLPAAAALTQLQALLGLRAKGVAYLDGGWQALVDQLEARATAAGVTKVTGATCTRVEDGGVVTLASGERLVAERVIVALPAQAALQLSGVDPSLAGPPVRAACLDLVLSRAPGKRLVFGLDEPHYLSVHSPRLSVAPFRVHAMRYLAPGESGHAQRGALETWLDRAAPGWRDDVLSARYLPEIDAASAMPSIMPPVPQLAGVSFVGDWVSPRHQLLDAVADSAQRAAGGLRASVAA